MVKRRAVEPLICFSAEGWQDYIYWSETDRRTLKRINELIVDALRDPFRGIGKPEPLRFALTGFWSRRIDQEHRLVYAFDNGRLTIIQCRYHY